MSTGTTVRWLWRPRLVHSGPMEIRHSGSSPSVDPDAYVAPTAVLSGQVRVGPGSCVLHGAVVSADGGPVEIGANCVIMEHAVLRGTPRHPLTIADHVLAGPHCYLSGCTVDDEVFIATGAMVFNGARMGRASSVALAAPSISAVWCRPRPGYRSAGWPLAIRPACTRLARPATSGPG